MYSFEILNAIFFLIIKCLNFILLGLGLGFQIITSKYSQYLARMLILQNL